jgi:hypothetical protein
MYLTFFDSDLGRLLIAASQPQVARERLDTGLQLAQDTGMRFYDAELLRLRAHTHPGDRRADITGALASPAGRALPSSNCARSSMISNYAASRRGPPSSM